MVNRYEQLYRRLSNLSTPQLGCPCPEPGLLLSRFFLPHRLFAPEGIMAHRNASVRWELPSSGRTALAKVSFMETVRGTAPEQAGAYCVSGVTYTVGPQPTAGSVVGLEREAVVRGRHLELLAAGGDAAPLTDFIKAHELLLRAEPLDGVREPGAIALALALPVARMAA